ncbi:MAG TPA: FAD-binding oxidoreductase [Thermoanaerobaculia bacterium]|jgi:FAD/FMN-containing dehydrogenase|nr:FAD-binding oxidoreductase [Thermoanaerobaculia bacterium]
MTTHESWGRYIPSRPARVVELEWTSATLPEDGLVLPYGLGRSYGDVPLNNGHTLLDTSRLNRFRSFDDATGVLECEAGTTLEEILRVFVPRGWFPPVTPGTKFVTVGGCIANDVHGKNHHRAGTFGRHVPSFELLRSDGTRMRCVPGEPLFAATIGGLGLTGLITTAEIQLRRIDSPNVIVERVPFRSLSEFDEISRACDATHEYTVAWFDSFAGRDSRGIFFRGNHAEKGRERMANIRKPQLWLPHSRLVLNPISVRMFNAAYFRANAKPRPQRVDYDPFFYPLDAVANWNSIYGPRGFLQYQCVIPDSAGLEPVGEILDLVARTRLASFLTVIKKFGTLPSPGLLSFPRAGTTICFDFAARRTDVLLPMLEQCDDVVEAAGGSVYPAKDARMSGARFRRFFPQWEELRALADPRFSSSFWRRVTA